MPIEAYFLEFSKLIAAIEAEIGLLVRGAGLAGHEAAVLECLGVPSVEGPSRRSKRLRGTLFLVGRRAQGQVDEASIVIASGMELLHGASLLLDDIQDGHKIRYERETLVSRVGRAIAQNIAIGLASAGVERRPCAIPMSDSCL